MVESEVRLSQKYEEIEHRVEKLIAICSSFELNNTQLNDKISGLEIELQTKSEALEKLFTERRLIRSKIDTLLERLNQIAEKNIDSKQ
jgi:hypothetical protein